MNATSRFARCSVAGDWFARAHPLPDQAHTEWARHGVALLPLGRRFEAIRIPAAHLHTAVGSAEPHTVAQALAERLHGPVFRDTRYSEAPYYALVPPDTAWADAEQHLGRDAYLGVPHPDGSPSPLACWVVPPPAPAPSATPRTCAHSSASPPPSRWGRPSYEPRAFRARRPGDEDLRGLHGAPVGLLSLPEGGLLPGG
ncbi:hypothetical protein [Streptomyces alboflavus]|uniref:hypothetical protein n=1 Tax=Streptomyces alboflavus TaxID=67267 RepID=UPI001F24C4ED|nr:hypothetical protein [Streptomyces alboflavus]